MAEIIATAAYPVSPLKSYLSQQKTDEEKQAGSLDTDRQAEKETTETGSAEDRVTLSREARQISELAAADRDVKNHEAAHSAAGGQFAGNPSYTYEQGPDGKYYTVAGEVPIDTSPVIGNPAATIKKAQIVRSAALAPTRPSAQDQQVAAKATDMQADALADIRTASLEEATESREEGSHQNSSPATDAGTPPTRSLDLYA